MTTVGGATELGFSVWSDHIYTSTSKFGWTCINHQFTDEIWASIAYNDMFWPSAFVAPPNPVFNVSTLPGGPDAGSWIWAETVDLNKFTYCRGYLGRCPIVLTHGLNQLILKKNKNKKHVD